MASILKNLHINNTIKSDLFDLVAAEKIYLKFIRI